MTQTFETLRIDDVTAGDLKSEIISMPHGIIKDLTVVVFQHVDGNVAAESRREHSSWFKGLHLIFPLYYDQ